MVLRMSLPLHTNFKSNCPQEEVVEASTPYELKGKIGNDEDKKDADIVPSGGSSLEATNGGIVAPNSSSEWSLSGTSSSFAAALGTNTKSESVVSQLASQYYSISRTRSTSAPSPQKTTTSSTRVTPTTTRSFDVWDFYQAQQQEEEEELIMAPVDLHGVDSKRNATTSSSTSTSTPSLSLGMGLGLGMDLGMPPMHSSPLQNSIGSAVVSQSPSDLMANLNLSEPENEPNFEMVAGSVMGALAHGDEKTDPSLLPATFLRSICDQLEHYFCDENLLGDLFLLKNMNMDGYVKLDLLASFGRVKKLTTDLEQIKKSLELSTKLLLSADETMVCRKDPLPPHQTYHGKLARTTIAYNLPEDASVASLRENFQGCGEITYLRLLKNNSVTGRNAVLKPPIAAGETYAIIEFLDEEMTKHAVLTLSDQYNWRTGMQVVLFDGTNVGKLKQKMFPVDVFDRRRAKSTSAVGTRPVHVEAVGEGLEDLKEGKISTGTIFSIRGAGGLITPIRHDTACISFRLVPDEDGTLDIRQGDYVSFTVGKNKKSGRKYASKVKLEFRPPTSLTGASNANSTSSSIASPEKDYFASSSPNRWESRSRASTIGAPPPPNPSIFRGRAGSTGTRPKLNLCSPRNSVSSPPSSNGFGSISGISYRQALGPDGTRGFGTRRPGGNGSSSGIPPLNPEVPSMQDKFALLGRSRSRSSAPAFQHTY